MTWSYSGNPASSLLDAVRYEIGDTLESDQLLSNEEIQYELSRSGDDTLRAAVRCCEAIAAEFARLADSAIGETRISASQKYKHYMDLAAKLRRQAYGTVELTVPEGEATFSKGMMDYTGE